ncbi:MAG: threonine--tRNA ligase [Actinobacteria bacterium]|nr:threonine--tRNA ligase [Actinomycetota bacterium]
MIKVKIDGIGTVEVLRGSKIIEAVTKLDKKAAVKAIAALLKSKRIGSEDRTVDMSCSLGEDTDIALLPADDKNQKSLDLLNHSTAHIMAAAIIRLYPDAKFAIGPAIKNGFYYDFDTSSEVSPDTLPAIEKEMRKIIASNQPFIRNVLSKEEAFNIFRGNPYKLELIREIGDPLVSTYTSGDFIDLCLGPHIPSTGKVRAFKLLSIAGAYWRGNEKNKMLVRIYGTSFFTAEELDKYLKKIELARESDHRKLGKELDLFSFHEEAPGFPFFHAKGMILRETILKYWREEHDREGYQEVQTPIILSNALWKTSGHWDNYKENMYFVKIDENDYAVKPMNCPGNILIYKSSQHSYRDLPLRLAELGLVHRHEKSGVLHGLFRVRNFTQDDAHIFCTEEQLFDEVSKVVDLVGRMYKVFGFEKYHMELSTRPAKSIGTKEMWDKAEGLLRDVLDSKNMGYVINEGDGAFYGPKIDFHIEDCLERTWQCATIQLDFAMPEKFDIEYMGEDNMRHRPAMIHRTVLGSLERFIGILIENYSGNLPPWLAPVQMVVLPISEKFHAYSEEIVEKLKGSGFRVLLDDRVESLGKKIRQSELQKIPYMIIAGEKEEKTKTITIRKKKGDDIKEVKLESFIKIAERVVANREASY